MSASHGTKAVLAAFSANTGIAIAKFVAWFLSGSASLLAEAIHSVAAAGNQLLLLLGGRLAKQQATPDHPFGYGRERYIWAFVVALVLYSVGGLISISEGIDKIQSPREIEVPWLPLTVLAVAIVLVTLSIRVAIKEADAVRGRAGWGDFIRKAKSPELPVVLLQELAALLGLLLALIAVGLTVLTGDPIYDAIGTLCIGALLIVVAAVLAVEMKSLLIGEGATREDYARIQRVLNANSGVESLIHMKTLYLGPDELMVAAKVAFPPQSDIEHVARTINDLESELRKQVPHARVIYIEPDLYVEQPEIAPSTDHIVIQSGN